jgi:hypothetical protein
MGHQENLTWILLVHTNRPLVKPVHARLLEISLTFIQDLVYMFRVYPLGILGIRKCVRHQNVSQS